MKVGDLVRVKHVSTGHGSYEFDSDAVALIVEGPNEVGKIKVLFTDGWITWLHSSEIEYVPKERMYLRE